MRALVVDDSGPIRKVLTTILSSFGFEVSQAETAYDALAILLNMPKFDLALFDWNMPGMDGLELLQSVRANDRYREMKIMMVTSLAEMNSIETALGNGADEYLMKPFSEDVVFHKLELLGLPLSCLRSEC